MGQFKELVEFESDRAAYRPEVFLEEEVEDLRDKLEERKRSWKQGEPSEVRRINFSDLKNPEDLVFLKRYFEHSLSEKDIRDYYQTTSDGTLHSSRRELCALARGQAIKDCTRLKYGETPESFGHYVAH